MKEKYPEWAFGDSPEMADSLLALVLEGKKTGTCGALWDYEYENEAIPKAGEKEIILDGKGKKACLIKLTNVQIISYNEVDAELAATEGEGDLSLEYWRKGHENFFRRTLAPIGKEFSEDMPLVFVNFKVLEKY